MQHLHDNLKAIREEMGFLLTRMIFCKLYLDWRSRVNTTALYCAVSLNSATRGHKSQIFSDIYIYIMYMALRAACCHHYCALEKKCAKIFRPKFNAIKSNWPITITLINNYTDSNVSYWTQHRCPAIVTWQCWFSCLCSSFTLLFHFPEMYLLFCPRWLSQRRYLYCAWLQWW